MRQDLKKLQSIWYKKLEESGFVDQENPDTGSLKNWSGHYISDGKRNKDFAGDLIWETNTYFHSAQHLLNKFSFRCIRDKQVWRLHCDGLSTRKIAARLGNIHYCTVFQIIKRIRAVFLTTETVPSIKLITVRDGEISDENFIYSTWLRPLYYGDDTIAYIRKDQFMAAMNKKVSKILQNPNVSVKIACLQDAPDVILGYSVVEWRRLWWVYVKKAWREMGIAKKLVPSHINSCAYLTDYGKMLKPDAWDVDPYLKEEVE